MEEITLTPQKIQEIKDMATMQEMVHNMQGVVNQISAAHNGFIKRDEHHSSIDGINKTIAKLDKDMKEEFEKQNKVISEQGKKIEKIDRYVLILLVVSQVVLWILNKAGDKLFSALF